MKTQTIKKFLAVTAIAGLGLPASNLLAQSSSTTGAATASAGAQPAAMSVAAPQLSSGVSQIMQLEQAKIGDNTIIAYIKNSGNDYGLDANQIIYLKQQGVSDAVITAMLNQPRPVVAAATVAPPAGASAAETTPLYSPRQRGQIPAASAGTSVAETSTATVAPTVTYVQTTPAPTYYYQPYYYPAYAWYPPVTFSFGWGWGGWRGGWHR